MNHSWAICRGFICLSIQELGFIFGFIMGWTMASKKVVSQTVSQTQHFAIQNPVPIILWPFQEPKLEVLTICKAYVRPMWGDIPPNMAKNMVQYLHFRILKFPLNHAYSTLNQSAAWRYPEIAAEADWFWRKPDPRSTDLMQKFDDQNHPFCS